MVSCLALLLVAMASLGVRYVRRLRAALGATTGNP
jgi:hypothetical protein